MTTDEVMALALQLAGLRAIPGDSTIYVDGAGIRRVLIAFDVNTAELLLARQLQVDAVIAHHPAGGSARLNAPQVLLRQVALMVKAGVPSDEARNIVQPAMTRALLRVQASNYDHIPSVARLLNIPFLNIHLPVDELGRRLMIAAVDRHLDSLSRASLVADVIDGLRTIPEIRDASTKPLVPVGRLDNDAGKVVVFHGAGGDGGFPIAQALFSHGVQTIVYPRLRPEEAEQLRALRLVNANVIVSGHTASDMIGMNWFIRQLEEHGIEVIGLGGL